MFLQRARARSFGNPQILLLYPLLLLSLRHGSPRFCCLRVCAVDSMCECESAAALGFLSVQAAKMLGGSNASNTALAGVEAVGYNHVMGTYTSSNYMCRAPTSNRDGLLLGTATSENPTTCQAVDGTGAATSLTSTVRAGCGSICACAACCARRRCLVCTRLVLCLMNLGLCGCHCHCSVGV